MQSMSSDEYKYTMPKTGKYLYIWEHEYPHLKF